MDLPQINFTFWILQTAAMLLTAFLIPKLTVTNPLGALAMVIAIAFVNANVWDAALFFNIPNHFSTQAATLWVVNGVIFWVLVKLLPGIEVKGFLPALVAPIVFTVCNLIISEYALQVDWLEVLTNLRELIEQAKDHFYQNVVSAPVSETPTASMR